MIKTSIHGSLLWLLLSLTTIIGCNTKIGIIPDTITLKKTPVIIKGTALVNVIEIVFYLDAVQDYLEEKVSNLPNTLVIVYPKDTLWWPRGKNVMTKAAGLAHLGEGYIRVEWDPELGAHAYAHERLHQAGWSHKQIDESQLDEEATKKGQEIRKQVKKLLDKLEKKLKNEKSA